MSGRRRAADGVAGRRAAGMAGAIVPSFAPGVAAYATNVVLFA